MHVYKWKGIFQLCGEKEGNIKLSEDDWLNICKT